MRPDALQKIGDRHADGRDIPDREVSGQPVRQHKARHQSRGNQPRDGIEPELCEARKAGRQERGKAAHGGEHSEAGWSATPSAANPHAGRATRVATAPGPVAE